MDYFKASGMALHQINAGYTGVMNLFEKFFQSVRRLCHTQAPENRLHR